MRMNAQSTRMEFHIIVVKLYRTGDESEKSGLGSKCCPDSEIDEIR